MTRSRARLVIGAGLAILAIVASAAAAAFVAGRPAPVTEIEIVLRYSHFEPATFDVPVGVPITITLRNDDPIDHEWIVGDAAVHQAHRTGTELVHPDRPTEIMVPAGETRVTTVTFGVSGSMQFICHWPAHEAYGMVGTVTIR